MSWFSKCSPWATSIRISWGLAKNINSQFPLRPAESESLQVGLVCVLSILPGDSDAAKVWKTLGWWLRAQTRARPPWVRSWRWYLPGSVALGKALNPFCALYLPRRVVMRIKSCKVLREHRAWDPSKHRRRFSCGSRFFSSSLYWPAVSLVYVNACVCLKVILPLHLEGGEGVLATPVSILVLRAFISWMWESRHILARGTREVGSGRAAGVIG